MSLIYRRVYSDVSSTIGLESASLVTLIVSAHKALQPFGSIMPQPQIATPTLSGRNIMYDPELVPFSDFKRCLKGIFSAFKLIISALR
jgi:hypothetical protein